MPRRTAWILCLALAAGPARAGAAGAARRASAQAIGHYLEARRAQAAGDWARALEELRLALVFDEGAPQIRVAHAEVLARLDRLDEAEREAARAVALDPEGEEAADAWLLQGRIAAHRKDRRRAADALRTAAALEARLAAARGPDEDRTPDPEPWRLLARTLLDAGDEEGAAAAWADLGRHLPAEAARGYRETARGFLEKGDAARGERNLRAAVGVLPGDAEAWKLLARLVERRGPAEGRAAWESALRADPDDVEALAALGRLAARGGDRPAAQAYFRQLRLVDPDDAGAAVAEASAWIEARRPEEALARLRAYDGAPDPRLPFARGLALEEQKRWPEAAAAYGEVPAEAGALWGDAAVNRAHALSQDGRHAEALRALDEVAEARPREARPIATRAWVLERMGRAAEAAEILRRALAQREASGDGDGASELTEALAQTLWRAGRPGEAVGLLQGALARRPRDEALLFALGVAHERAGDMDAALAQMKALLVLAPDHAEALNFVGYTYAERGVRLEEAERLLGRALELRPGNGFFLDSLGWIHFQKGDLPRAVTVLEQADAAAGAEATILEHLGDAYRRSQRAADAEKAYRRALRTLDAGEGEDGPEKKAQQRAGLERKLRELGGRSARP